jgi:hypothetical protein
MVKTSLPDKRKSPPPLPQWGLTQANQSGATHISPDRINKAKPDFPNIADARATIYFARHVYAVVRTRTIAYKVFVAIDVYPVPRQYGRPRLCGASIDGLLFSIKGRVDIDGFRCRGNTTYHRADGSVRSTGWMPWPHSLNRRFAK